MQDPAPYVVTPSTDVPAIVLMQCPLAGFQFHAGELHWRQMRVRDPLSLVREPGNHHDPRAVRVEWHNVVLGYLPREANYMASQMLDRGHGVNARIAAMHEGADPWKRVMLELEWTGPARQDDNVRNGTGITYVNLGSFVARPPPSTIKLAKGINGPSAEVQRIGTMALARCSADVIARLAMPVTGAIGPVSRSVRLWNLVEITITSDGRTLTARSLDGASRSLLLTANLSMPLGSASWTTPFMAMVQRPFEGHDMSPTMQAGESAGWLARSLRRTFDGFIDFAFMRRAVLEFLAPDELTRSLANRIFDNAPNAGQFNWCGRHREALCLVAIEHAPLLPFLRYVEREGAHRVSDPMASLNKLFQAAGLAPGAAKRLERWGHEPFSDLGQEQVAGTSTGALVGFANLLYRLEVCDKPPKFFSLCAGAAANWFDCDLDDPIFGTLIPDWFMHALLREVEKREDKDNELDLGGELMDAMSWITSMPLEPDANQRKAGWRWIMERVKCFQLGQAKGEWPVPLDAFTTGGYHVIPIGALSDLKIEAMEMKNCLESYADKCRCGTWAVFSIRTPLSAGGKRVANLAAVKTRRDGVVRWQLHQVAGKMNMQMPAEIQRVAEAVVAALNSPV